MSRDSIRARLAAVWPGEWSVSEWEDGYITIDQDSDDGLRIVAQGLDEEADAALIAHAPTDIAALLAVADAASAAQLMCADMCPAHYDEPCNCGRAALRDALAALEATR